MKTQLASLTLLFLFGAGCASGPHPRDARDVDPGPHGDPGEHANHEHAATTETGAAHAKCQTCAFYRDLACIDVDVDAATPRLDYQGKTYYFCSEQCKTQFQKDPEKYVKHAKAHEEADHSEHEKEGGHS
ncbi:MAG: YHS domain-containing protein [Acidobacteriota bacterium]